MDVNLLTVPFWLEVVYEDYEWITVAWSLNGGPVQIQTLPNSDDE